MRQAFFAAGRGEQMKKYSTASFGLSTGKFTCIGIWLARMNQRFGSLCRQLCEVGKLRSMSK